MSNQHNNNQKNKSEPATNTCPENDTHDHDHGLYFDLSTLLARRQALGWITSVGTALSATAFLSACGPDGPFAAGPEQEVSGVAPSGTICIADPSETAGPFPADGSNNANGTVSNVLKHSGIIRKDMRPNLPETQPDANQVTSQAEGMQLDLNIALVNVSRSCQPLSGHVIYLWHCDKDGHYSIYDLPEKNYLRAVAITDAEGKAEFTTIFPGCYPGRYPHMHFEIYRNINEATDYQNRILTSQLAMPEKICQEIYQGLKGYSSSLNNFAGSPLAADNIFANNTEKQLAAQTPEIKGNINSGYQGDLTIGVAL